jgi:hypothetical protein
VATGLAVVAVLASGCSEPQQASETLPSAVETSESPALEPLGPPDFPVPDEARVQDAAGAEAFLRYYLELVERQASRGGQPLRDLSLDCSFCQFLADRADEDAAAGYQYVGGVLTIDSMSPPAVTGALAEFAFSASQSAVQILDADGNPVSGRGADAISNLSGAAAMNWSSTAQVWLMTQLRFVQR